MTASAVVCEDAGCETEPDPPGEGEGLRWAREGFLIDLLYL
jgi:hypothetical protein